MTVAEQVRLTTTCVRNVERGIAVEEGDDGVNIVDRLRREKALKEPV